MFSFGKKTVIGLDIGSSQVKAVELEPHGGSYRLRGFGFALLPPEAIVQGSFMNAPAISARDRRGLRDGRLQVEGRGHVGLRPLGDREADLASGAEQGRARGDDPLGSGAVHPVRHQRSEHRPPDPARVGRRRPDGRAARRRQEGPDRRLRQRDHRVGPLARGDGRRRLRGRQHVPAQLPADATRRRSRCSTWAPRSST